MDVCCKLLLALRLAVVCLLIERRYGNFSTLRLGRFTCPKRRKPIHPQHCSIASFHQSSNRQHNKKSTRKTKPIQVKIPSPSISDTQASIRAIARLLLGLLMGTVARGQNRPSSNWILMGRASFGHGLKARFEPK